MDFEMLLKLQDFLAVKMRDVGNEIVEREELICSLSLQENKNQIDFFKGCIPVNKEFLHYLGEYVNNKSLVTKIYNINEKKE